MVTKYDVGDEVLVKAKIQKVSSDKKGKINYALDIPNCIKYLTFEEQEITGKVEEKKSES